MAIPRLSEAAFLATLREPLRALDCTPKVLARIRPHLPEGTVVHGVSESFDGMFTHVLAPAGTDRWLTFVINNASGLLTGYFLMAV